MSAPGRTGALLTFALATLAMVACVGLPLMTYTLSLAMFGLAHVLSEMRYVHARFGPHLERRLVTTLATLLLGVVALRVGVLTGFMPARMATGLELSLVVLLSLVAIPTLWAERGIKGAATGALVTLALGLGLLVSPIHTILTLAVLHNLTPLGFLLDALRDHPQRTPLLLGALTLFLGVPALIATGLPFHVMHQVIGWTAIDATILPSGPVWTHFGAYLPKAWHGEPWALHAFSAVVFAQLMHYAAVLHLLPRLLPPEARAEPGADRAFLLAIVGVGVVLFIGFALDFKQARSVYGIASALHAWIEVPILMIALLGVLGPSAKTSA